MTNKTILGLILVAFGGFGCAVEAEDSAPGTESLSGDEPGFVLVDPSLFPILPAPVVFEQPTTHAAAGPAPSNPEPGSTFGAVDPSSPERPEPGSTFEAVDPSDPGANPEPGSTFGAVDPSEQGASVGHASDGDLQPAKGAPGVTGYDDPTIGGHTGGCWVVDGDSGEWIVEPCPES